MLVPWQYLHEAAMRKAQGKSIADLVFKSPPVKVRKGKKNKRVGAKKKKSERGCAAFKKARGHYGSSSGGAHA